MHEYDREARTAIDRQLPFYSGEASFALSRAYAITHNPLDLQAASAGLRHLVGPAWSFFGNHYYYAEEHWTCQALEALWAVAPDPRALEFCLGFASFNRALQQRAGESAFDADGALGVGPFMTPKLTPVATRSEATLATLAVAGKAGRTQAELRLLTAQVRRALALLLRQQFLPGPSHLFKNAAHTHGGLPASSVDFRLRIDFAQHAGSAFLRWLELENTLQ